VYQAEPVQYVVALAAGRPLPGATPDAGGTNFAVSASGAHAVELCLFDGTAERRLELPQRSGSWWHGYVPGIGPGQLYGFRAHGPNQAAEGQRYNPSRLLLDPYARAISGPVVWHPSLFDHPEHAPAGWEASVCLAGVSTTADPAAGSAPFVPRSVVVDNAFDWADDRRPGTALADSVIYEVHLKGFSAAHPDVPPNLRGTYAGMAHPAVTEYLVALGVSAVELLPVHQFVSEPALAARGLTNFWGYNSIGFFAPHGAYSSAGDAGAQVNEFKSMVKALHSAGIEVILDVVYNHTAEGGTGGPTLCFKGLDNAAYYRLEPGDRSRYVSYSGTGNTLDASNPLALRLILDSLRYWVGEMGVDGFRFDLAPALSRHDHGYDPRSAFLSAIAQDPVLQGVKLIAEPWDATGPGYQLGNFPHPWSEWNDRYRGAARDYWQGHAWSSAQMGSLLAGSSELFESSHRPPSASINFVTAHDGFTLRDLVSYDRKHNRANGEDGRDGSDDNRSWNCGAEGETADPVVLAMRARQIRNLLTTLLVSQGVPMVLAGDELHRTQRGNNNPYCQDGPLTWLDWSPSDEAAALYEFTRNLIALRASHPVLRQTRFLTGRPAGAGQPPDVVWFAPDGQAMSEANWSAPGSGAFGMLLNGGVKSLLIVVNGSAEPVAVVLGDPGWVASYEVVVDTAGRWEGAWRRPGDQLKMPARSMAVARARPLAGPADSDQVD